MPSARVYIMSYRIGLVRERGDELLDAALLLLLAERTERKRQHVCNTHTDKGRP